LAHIDGRCNQVGVFEVIEYFRLSLAVAGTGIALFFITQRAVSFFLIKSDADLIGWALLVEIKPNRRYAIK
jgi:hypothetical protein